MGRYKVAVGISALSGLAMIGQLATGGAAQAARVFPVTPGPAPQAAAAVCGPANPGEARCNSQVVVGPDGTPLATATPSGYGPADLQSAYKLTVAGSGTVAIVDAYDDPNAFSDVNAYRTQFGLAPLVPSTSPSGSPSAPTFTKWSQSGVANNYPKTNGGWAQEISLDLDMVSAICPGCNILLVEASSSSLSNLGSAVDTAAATPGVVAISNSYGGGEYSSENLDTHYNHTGVAITVSSGDSGYGVQYPAASQYVTAVGGTTLNRGSNTRGWTETAWSGAGSGCSKYDPKPSWQTDTGCPTRTVADVSAVANPNTGVAVYDSFAYRGASGWMVFGGTSVGSPIIASVYALAGNASTVTTPAPLTSTTNGYGSYPYSHASSLFDVTSGSNGSCGGTYLCTAIGGYDGPTGLGTPNGTGGF